MSGAFAIALLNLVPLLLQGVAGAADVMLWGKERVQDMVDNQRDPTPEEWDELNNRTQTLRDALHSDAPSTIPADQPVTFRKTVEPEPSRSGPQSNRDTPVQVVQSHDVGQPLQSQPRPTPPTGQPVAEERLTRNPPVPPILPTPPNVGQPPDPRGELGAVTQAEKNTEEANDLTLEELTKKK